MLLKEMTVFPLMCAVLGLAGCGSSSPSSNYPVSQPQAQKPQVTTPNSNGDTTPTAPQTGTTASDETVAKESFLKTLASGDKKLNLKNIAVEYTKSNMKNGTVVKEQWTSSWLSVTLSVFHFFVQVSTRFQVLAPKAIMLTAIGIE